MVFLNLYLAINLLINWLIYHESRLLMMFNLQRKSLKGSHCSKGNDRNIQFKHVLGGSLGNNRKLVQYWECMSFPQLLRNNLKHTPLMRIDRRSSLNTLE